MPDLYLIDSGPEWPDAERLSLAWNALAQGESDATAALDPEDAAVIERLRAFARGPNPRPDFVSQLKEQLMDSSIPLTTGGTIHREPPFPIVQPRPQAPAGWRQRWGDSSRRSLGAVATIALLVVTLVGTYLAVSWSNPGGNDQRDTAGLVTGATPAANASPEASPRAAFVCPSDAWFGCPDPLRLVGGGIVWHPNLEDAVLEARQVQLQGWAVAPGAAVVGVDGGDAASGVVVDFVLSGTYVATFDVPVVVGPGGWTNDRPIEYLDAGETVELGRGDAIAYQLGGLVELHNPLSQQRIEFKRAVIYEGDVSAFSATADGVTTRVEGDATMPEALGAVGQGNTWVQLWYGWVLPGMEFPPQQWATDTVIGPVDPQRAPEGIDGFILWIGSLEG